MDQLLWYLFAGTRGGPNRLRIVDLIHGRPYNAHQIAELTGLDYRTVCHHLDVLVRHHVLVSPNRDAYGALYFLSGLTTAEWPTVVRIKSRPCVIG
jgi:DNA-binding transcriptional ArsR family regulator